MFPTFAKISITKNFQHLMRSQGTRLLAWLIISSLPFSTLWSLLLSEITTHLEKNFFSGFPVWVLHLGALLTFSVRLRLLVTAPRNFLMCDSLPLSLSLSHELELKAATSTHLKSVPSPNIKKKTASISDYVQTRHTVEVALLFFDSRINTDLNPMS